MEKEEFDNEKYMNMELLRFTTAGSVDDGKSTLIGRLLYDSKSIFEDQYEAIKKSSEAKGEEHINLALLTDGLKDEIEQGITIDVAYRYFATPKRKFIIADTPGHIQYTRNMVTGASTANLAIILVDARHGVVEQTCRHAFIASLLKIPHVIICINKMDLVDYSQEVYDKVKTDFKNFSSKLEVTDVRFIPISALKGDNVVKRSENMDWFDGPTLMYQLENVHIASDRNYVDCRFPVQNVIRPMSDKFHDFRGYGGRVAGGIFKPGDKVTILPSGLTSTIKTIELYDKKLEKAYPPMSVTITLEDDVDVSRGDMIVRDDNQPEATQDIEIMVCWLNDKPLVLNGLYAIKHTSKEARCKIVAIKYKVDVNTLHRMEDDKAVGKNDIARISIRTTHPLFIDKYRRNRNTGSIIIIDEGTNNTVGAGMII
ncbi:MAG: sulfate adenylyltransferase subunit CysN [Flavobacteriales bacterium]|nr:sulfate adenylyltransferase subunit CysN [Flavobacteriales bacterium]